MPPRLHSASVILVGEIHYYTPFVSYEFLIRAVSADSRPCLAVELPQAKLQFDNSLAALKKRYEEMKRTQVNGESLKRVKRVLETYSKISALAKPVIGFVIMPVVVGLNINKLFDASTV